jgi:aquaporin Z
MPEITGALLGRLFVKCVIGNKANLDVNPSNYTYPIPVIFGIEVMAYAFLMSVTLIVVYTR